MAAGHRWGYYHVKTAKCNKLAGKPRRPAGGGVRGSAVAPCCAKIYLVLYFFTLVFFKYFFLIFSVCAKNMFAAEFVFFYCFLCKKSEQAGRKRERETEGKG